MTTNPSPQPRKPLRIVVPKSRKPVPKPDPNPEVVSAPVPEPGAAESSPETAHSNPWIRRGIILSGLTLAAFIPTPYWVGGDVVLESSEGQRQAVYAPTRAVVEAIHVEPGDTVYIGEPLVTLRSLDLEQAIADVEEKLAAALENQEALQLRIKEAENRQDEAEVLAQSAQNQASRYQERVAQLESGENPPELNRLITEEADLVKQLEEAEQNLNRIRKLAEDGGVSLQELDREEQNFNTLASDLEAKRYDIDLMQRQLREDAADRTDAAIYQQTLATSTQQTAAASQELVATQNTIQGLEQRLKELQEQEEALVVTAQVAGRVLGEDLDLVVGQELQPNVAILRVEDLTELTAHIEIREDDLPYVEIGAPAKFRSQQAKHLVYEARIEAIPYNYLEADVTENRRVATVKLTISNEDESLRPDSSGYAKIFSEWIPLYQRVGREISKLIPIRFL
jgi:multidrug resistance efflux pump